MIEIDVIKAKEIAHTIRRNRRTKEFAPFDKLFAEQIPGINLVDAEFSRQQIRDRYADMQEKIDSSSTPEEIKSALEI